jgi:cell division protein ZipA
MSNLRWALLALGILVLLGIYSWGKGWLQPLIGTLLALWRKPRPPKVRVEPEIQTDELNEPPDSTAVAPNVPAVEQMEKVVTLRFVPVGGEIASDRVILALRRAGLKHGKYGIFHMHSDELGSEPMFSVASLTEPGSFDLSKLAESTIPGMSFFMLLPGTGNAVDRFDAMVATAKSLARELDGELRDEKGSSWSIQRERYVREEVIEYEHLLDKPFRG